MESASSLEAIVRRDRLVVTAGLVGVTVLAWAYTIYLAWTMPGAVTGAELAMPRMHSWQVSYLPMVFVMWAVMMVAMMVPSASPLILLFAKINRTRDAASPALPTAALVAGYVLLWTAYGAVATLAQWGLHHAALLSPSAASASPLFGGALLIAAGIFQWTPLKEACLTQCRSPLAFLMSEWREGKRGAWIMGIKHGWFCVGCCWVLMALLFVAGVMNLLWMAAITAFVLAEKLLPKGELVARAGGVVLVIAGVFVLVTG
jgi:predicted metal-binding membrane protein